MALFRLKCQVFPVLRPLGNNQRFPIMGQALPDFLGDERHKRMQQPQNLIQYINQNCHGSFLALGILGIQASFRQLDIPVTIGIPDKVIYFLDCNTQFVFFQVFGDFGDQRIELAEYPLVRNFQFLCFRETSGCVFSQVHHDVARSVPKLVGKIAHCFTALHIETHVISRRVAGDHIHPQSIAAVFINHLQRVNAVAQRLGHFPSLIIPDQAMDQHSVERCFAGMGAAGEDHSGNPEENNVITGDQNIGGIEIIQILGLFRPAKSLKGPQGRAEPSIQHIRISLDPSTATLFALADIFPGYGNVAAICTGPGGNLMSPPQLTGDTPVTDIFHPIQVGFAETLWNKFGFILFDNPDGLFCQRLHLDEPLGRNDRLHILMAAITCADVVAVVFYFYQIAASLQIGNNGLTGIVAIHSFVLSAQLVNLTIVIQNTDHFQIVPQTNFKVVGIMGRCHLDASSAELHLRIVIGNNRNFFVHQGQNDFLAHDSAIAFIVGIDTDTGISQHSLRTGSSHNHFPAAVSQRITDMPQMARLVHILHFCIRQGSDTVGAPVDNSAALVYQTFFIQGNKHFPDSFGATLVHSKAGTIPIAGGAQFLLLLHNPVSVFIFPIPHPFQELLPAQIITGQAFFSEFLFHLDLCSNTSMVNAGHPQGIITLHPLKPD